MSRKPIDILLDRVDFRCVRCDAKMGTCNCFEPVQLKCPVCGVTKKVPREKSDPVNAFVIELKYPKCWGPE